MSETRATKTKRPSPLLWKLLLTVLQKLLLLALLWKLLLLLLL